MVKRIIDALDEPQHTFVLHVDLKVRCTVCVSFSFFLMSSAITLMDVYFLQAESLYGMAVQWVAQRTHKNVYLLSHEERQNASWGGFSIVNATLRGAGYSLLVAFSLI